MRAFFAKLYKIWISERPSQLAAALAYYGMFSFAPVIFMAFTVAGLFIDQLAAAERIYQELEAILGTDTSVFIRDTVTSIGNTTRGGTILGSLISFIALFAAASGLFFQLQNALNKIWLVPPPEEGQTGNFIRQRLFSFIMVLGVGFMLTLATLANLIVGWLGSRLEMLFDITFPSIIWTGLGNFILIALSLALLYKILPDMKIAWRDVWLGSVTATILVMLFILLLGLYLDSGLIGSAFEAAGAFALVLIGIYYIAQIFLLGAVFCRVYATLYGSQRFVA